MSKFDKIKLHLHNNKKAYITGGVCLVVGVTVGAVAMYTRPEVVQSAKQINLFSPKSTQNVIQIVMERAGNAGNVWIDNETGENFMSTRKLAEALGVTTKIVRDYSKGLLPDINGRQFSMVCDGVSELVVTQNLAPSV
jgi:hypothetical protein